MDTGLRMRAMSELFSTVYSAGSGMRDGPGPPPLPRRPVRSGILSTCASGNQRESQDGVAHKAWGGCVACLPVPPRDVVGWRRDMDPKPSGPGRDLASSTSSSSSYGEIGL